MSPRFSLDDYEPVDERLARFYKDNPRGRVLTWIEWHDPDMSKLVFGAKVYRDEADNDYDCWASGFAFEILGSTPVNKTSHVENAETSAIGRALANAGYATKGKRPSREEMEKAQRVEAKPELPAEPLVTDSQVARINALRGMLTKAVGEERAKAEYAKAYNESGANPAENMLETQAARIITALELSLSVAKESAAKDPPAADGATSEPGAGSGGPLVGATPAAPKISKKQRDLLTRRREELWQFTGSDEAWYSLLADEGVQGLDELDGAAARRLEHAANTRLKQTDFVPVQKRLETA